MMQEQVGRDRVEGPAVCFLRTIEDVGGDGFDRPSQRGEIGREIWRDETDAIEHRQLHLAPVPCHAPGYFQHEGAVAGADLQNAARWPRQKFPQQRDHDRRLEHQRVDAGEIAARVDCPRIVGSEPIKNFRDEAAVGERGHATVLNSMVSAVSPGPNDMPQPSKPPGFFSISSITNMTVGDDILPYRRSTSRDGSSAAGSRSSALSTASRTVRPPGCTAQRSIASGGRSPRKASWLLRNTSWIAVGTWPERTMSKPWSRISHLIRPRRSS